MPRRRMLVAALMALLPALPVHAADVDKSRQVVLMVYDIGLYSAELDRVMAQAGDKRIYAGSTPAARARNRVATRAAMLGQREAVLSATTIKVAARATDPELDALLRMAGAPDATPDTRLVNEAVTVVKSSFEEALWDQLARTARGAAEFPCTRDQRSRCS